MTGIESDPRAEQHEHMLDAERVPAAESSAELIAKGAANRVHMVTDMLDAFARAVEICLGDTSALDDSDDFVRVLASVRDCRAGLALFAAELERALIDRRGPGRWTVDGYGECQVRKSISRTRWDDDGLARRVVALALDERVLDESTGEFESAHAAVARVLLECSKPSWRVTPLRARGIQVDEWCEEDEAHLSLQLPRAT